MRKSNLKLSVNFIARIALFFLAEYADIIIINALSRTGQGCPVPSEQGHSTSQLPGELLPAWPLRHCTVPGLRGHTARVTPPTCPLPAKRQAPRSRTLHTTCLVRRLRTQRGSLPRNFRGGHVLPSGGGSALGKTRVSQDPAAPPVPPPAGTKFPPRLRPAEHKGG